MRSAAGTRFGGSAIVLGVVARRARRHRAHRARHGLGRRARSRTTTSTSAVRARPTRSCRRSSSARSTRRAARSSSARAGRTGIRTAVQYVNRYLGGVQGHPLVVSYCFTTSAEEEGTKCGQKFANDKRIKVVEFGAVAVGNQSFYAALGNNKPTVGGVELLPVDAQRKNGFALFGTNDSVLGPWGTFGKDVLKAKTAAVVYMQVPGIDYGAQVEKASLESAGIKTTHGRLRRERDRPDRAADRRRRAERRHDRPADERERLRRPSPRRSRSSGRAARRSSRTRSVSTRRCRGGARRRPAEVGSTASPRRSGSTPPTRQCRRSSRA